MRFEEVMLPGAFKLTLERKEDERGFFARVWCQDEFAQHGIDARFVQASISFNHRKGTLRGMHFQLPPHSEAKLVRCSRGAIYDVIADVRPDSPTYLHWYGTELSAAEGEMLFVPAGYAHGFQTLEDATEVQYDVSEFYAPATEAGFRYDDPLVRIAWPLPVEVISNKDLTWSSLPGPGSREGAATQAGTKRLHSRGAI